MLGVVFILSARHYLQIHSASLASCKWLCTTFNTVSTDIEYIASTEGIE